MHRRRCPRFIPMSVAKHWSGPLKLYQPYESSEASLWLDGGTKTWETRLRPIFGVLLAKHISVTAANA